MIWQGALASVLSPPGREDLRLFPFSLRQSQTAPGGDCKEPSQACPCKLPPLDNSQQQASHRYWPGATSSTGSAPTSTAQATNLLPTPPTDSADGYKPPGQGFKSNFSDLAATTLQYPGMGPNLDHTGVSSSLTQRRPAAHDLPNFELPAPFNPHFQPKYNLPQLTQAQGTTVGGGNLLTPPSTIPGDSISPLSSIINSANSNQGVSSNYNYGWPPLNTGLTPLMGTASGNTPQPWQTSLHPVKGLFSPSLAGSLPRGESNSPTAGDSLPPPPYDLNGLPPLATSMSMGAPSTLPAMAAQQHATMQAYMAQGQPQAQTPMSAATTQPSPVGGTESFVQRPQSTPSTFYSQSQPSSAQQSTFPPFNNQSSPIQQPPMSAPPQSSRISPMSSQSATFSPPTTQSNGFGRSSYAPYLPAMSAPPQMSGPVMSNIHNPGNPMGLMGMQSHGLPGGMIPNYHSGTAAQIQQQMYGGQQQSQHNERPFKCDQCPQSFNRNHDLKRHKRIHLAVKPFPCGYCDKSFSRKDALKVSHDVYPLPFSR